MRWRINTISSGKSGPSFLGCFAPKSGERACADERPNGAAGVVLKPGL